MRSIVVAFGALRLARANASCDRGASAVEYGILVGCVAGAVVVAVALLGEPTIGLFAAASNVLSAANLAGLGP